MWEMPIIRTPGVQLESGPRALGCTSTANNNMKQHFAIPLTAHCRSHIVRNTINSGLVLLLCISNAMDG